MPRRLTISAYQNIQWAEFIKRLFKEAEQYLAVRGDMPHARVSHDYARTIMHVEGGERRIIEPAVILHDVGWSALEAGQISIAYGVLAEGREADRLNRIHEVEGSRIAREILKALNYDSQLSESIVSIILNHDSGVDVSGMEEGVVRDADRLWRYSKTGFWEEKKRQMLEAEQLYKHLMKHLRNWFFTPTALILAERELKTRRVEIKTGKQYRSLLKRCKS